MIAPKNSFQLQLPATHWQFLDVDMRKPCWLRNSSGTNKLKADS
jgi:hypothetical protein